MKKISSIIMILSMVLLFGCKIQIIPNDDTQPTNDTNTDVSKDTSTNTPTTTTPDQGQTGLEIGDLIIYTDGTCQLEVCQKTVIDSIIGSELNLKFDSINYIDLQKDQEAVAKITSSDMNKLPLLELTKAQYDKIAVAIPDIAPYIKTSGDNYYLSLFVWEFGKENDCTDSVDNDNDGAIDAADEDCNKVIILGDKRCDPTENQACNIDFIEESLSRQIFPLGYYYERLDYNDAAGMMVYDKVKGTGDMMLPLVVVNNLHGEILDLLKNDNALEEVQIDENMNYMLKLIQGTWNPIEADKCLKYNEEGVLNAMCENEECKSLTQCKPDKKGQLELFVMGYCPFGELAAKALPTILEQFKNDNIDLQIYYIANHDGIGYQAANFQSLHGEPESEENIRQLCVQKYYGLQKLVDYMQERYKNANNYGQVTDEPSISIEAIGGDLTTIQDCVSNGEGGKLLAENAKRADELAVSGSPTWYANDKYRFGGYAAADIITTFCKYNPELNGCKGEINVSNDVNTGETPQCGN